MAKLNYNFMYLEPENKDELNCFCNIKNKWIQKKDASTCSMGLFLEETFKGKGYYYGNCDKENGLSSCCNTFLRAKSFKA
jgi:hypothetical protein